MAVECSPNGATWNEYPCITAAPGSCEATNRRYTQQRTYTCVNGVKVEASGLRKFVRCGC
ncbi:hypothetical protein GCM10010344_76910 [Streptomyces bluensis]|nr:hypothetical protein GCM10010344_76910 [Streptomyces bluensis]